jgi:K+-sensing histidine kinase KdpD
MSNSNRLLWRKRPVSWGYGIAGVSVLAVLLLSHWPVFHLESAPVSLFLCSVIFSAWFGGAGPGFLAAILSALAFYYSFLPPADSLAAKPGQISFTVGRWNISGTWFLITQHSPKLTR